MKLEGTYRVEGKGGALCALDQLAVGAKDTFGRPCSVLNSGTVGRPCAKGTTNTGVGGAWSATFTGGTCGFSFDVAEDDT